MDRVFQNDEPPRLNRRNLISAIVFCCLPADLQAEPNEASDWSLFNKLAGALNALLHSGDALGDSINRMKLRQFARTLQPSLGGVVEAKQRMLQLMQTPTCDARRGERLALLNVAREDSLSRTVALGGKVETLATAVSPSVLSGKFADVGLQMRYLAGMQGGWYVETANYCSRSPAERTILRGQALRSLQAAAACHRGVVELLAALA